ncbi:MULTISPECIES: protein-export chaperone SecB [unclassified Exiguobacterium]|uniref:protein-export chaperone SecB n=1 Tax=unclassified Exiguobacterium TaxID=2644629 RepID=UPI001BECEF3A|nr:MULTISPECIES: protein-export chaperone SecB [unclassified Exiguobacterium]
MKKLKFERYRIDNLSFKQNNQSQDNNNINVAMASNVEQINDNSAIVSLICHLNSEDEKFELSLQISGDFVVEEDEKEENIHGVTNEILFNRNSLSILFPYLRSAVSQVTSIGYQEPIILPPINILDFIKKSE